MGLRVLRLGLTKLGLGLRLAIMLHPGLKLGLQIVTAVKFVEIGRRAIVTDAIVAGPLF